MNDRYPLSRSLAGTEDGVLILRKTMKQIIIIVFIILTSLSSFSQTKNHYYFTNPSIDDTSMKKGFNGIKLSAAVRPDMTETFWFEFRCGWYRRSNKIFGIHPALNIGYNLPEVVHYLSGNKIRFFIEPGISLAYHSYYVNLRLNNYLTNYIYFRESSAPFIKPAYLITVELGYYFNRFELNFEIGASFHSDAGISLYGTYGGFNLGIILGNMKYPRSPGSL